MVKKDKTAEPAFCKWCLEHLEEKSQKEHDAECPMHPCFDCDDYGTKECVICVYSRAR